MYLPGLHSKASGVALNEAAQTVRKVKDGFVRETFTLPRTAAREKAREWFDRWPKQAYWTEIESWFEQPDDVIQFTIRRLPTAD